jgi:mannose-6-phosphate isomerase-like protein (cupin superfamily)
VIHWAPPSQGDDQCTNDSEARRHDVSKVADAAYILRPGEGRSIDLRGFRMSVKAADEQTNGAFSLLEAEEPAAFGPPLHIHRDAAEAFYVLEGEYVIYLDAREFVCPAGSFIFIPAGLPHGFRVGGVASRKLNLYTLAAMVGYFDDVAVATKAGDVDPDRLSEIALRYSMEVIGPVPKGYV